MRDISVCRAITLVGYSIRRLTVQLEARVACSVQGWCRHTTARYPTRNPPNRGCLLDFFDHTGGENRNLGLDRADVLGGHMCV